MGKQWGISVRGYYEGIVVGLGLMLDDSREERRKCGLSIFRKWGDSLLVYHSFHLGGRCNGVGLKLQLIKEIAVNHGACKGMLGHFCDLHTVLFFHAQK